MQTFHGAWPALVTPFTDENQVDTDALVRLIDYLQGKHVGGYYLCGSTGQGIYMSVAERKRVTDTVLAQVPDDTPIIVHVGAQALVDAVELAEHAQAAGAAGVSSIIPAGFGDMESIGRYYAGVAAAAPEIPFLPYLFTSALDSVALMESLRGIPNLAGSKYTGPNMHEFQRIVGAGDAGWSLFSGMDEQCVFAAMFGSCGNIGSTLNVIPGVYRRIHECVHAGDPIDARDLQTRANQVTQVLFDFGFMGALYRTLALLGAPSGGPRLPAAALPADQVPALEAALEAVGFAELAAM